MEDSVSLKKLNEALETLSSVLNAGADTVLLLDRNGNILFANEASAKRRKLSVPEIIGKCAYGFYVKNVAAARKQKVDGVFQSGEAIRFEDMEGGLYYDNILSPVFNDDGSVGKVAVYARDVTKNKLAEEELSDIKTRLAQTERAAGVGYLDWDIASGSLHCSSEIYKSYGLDPKDGVPSFPRIASMIHPDHFAAVQAATAAMEGVKPLSVDFRIIRPDGQVRWLHSEGEMIRDSSGKPVRFIGAQMDITAAKQSADKLKESETLLKSVFANINTGIFVSDFEGSLITANATVAQMAGYESVEEFLKMPASNLYANPADRRRLISALAEKGSLRNEEFLSAKKDGSTYWVSISAVVLKEDGGASRILGSVEDIGWRKASEEALKISEDRYRTIMESSPVAIVIVGLDGTILECSAAAVAQSGYSSKDDIIGRSFLTLINPAEKEKALEGMSRVILESTSSNKSYSFIKEDGTIVPVEASASIIRDRAGNPVSFIAVALDISERKNAEAALRESEEKYRRIVDTAKEGIWVLDVNYETTFVNDRMCEMIGYGREEVIGRGFEPFMFEEDIPDHNRKVENRRHGIVEQYERRIRRKDGSVLWTILSPQPVFGERGEFQGVFAMFTDITPWKQAERDKEILQQQLLHAQKMEAIGQLAGGIAHDFNNILSVIIGTSEMALRGIPPGDPGASRIQRIINVSNRAKDLTMKLLTFARKEKLDIRSAPAVAIISELTDMLKRSIPGNIKILTSIEEPGPGLSVDFNQILQSLLNICNNARDAMPDGGTLSIKTSETFLDPGACKNIPGAEPGKYCLIEISDDGHGFDPAIAGKIFEPFFTTKDQGKGTGLGLSITLGIIQNHKGLIDIQTVPGRGTTVRIHLPASESETAADETTQRPINGNLKKASILIVDDNPEFLDTLAETLDYIGFTPVSAASGAEAVKIYAGGKDRIDLVILDMMMPEMDGGKTFIELKKLNPAIKAILCSGYSIDDQARKILDEGIHGHLQKPFKSEELLRVISQALAG